MVCIYNISGRLVSRSKNLAGIRRYAGKHGVQHVELWSIQKTLTVEFGNGARVRTEFADFSVLQRFVRNWRNARGASLMVNGIERGTVTSSEPSGY